MAESFWVLPDVTDMRTPLSILREQANALVQQTKGVLVGMVEVRGDATNGNLAVNLDVSVPALNDYRYRILSYHQSIELYPGAISMHSCMQAVSVADEEGFISAVKHMLSSEKTKRVL